MRKAPLRTHTSDLTDDELILFDFLWDGDAPQHMLYSEAIAVHGNTPYSHSIPDEQLPARFLDLVERGLLRSYAETQHAVRSYGSEDCFGLTKRGFEAWESERLPDWSRYINDSWVNDCLTVAAISAEHGSRFIEICRESGLWDIGEAMPIHSVKTKVSLVEWKTFGEVHYFDIPTTLDGMRGSVNWTLYESKRSWWRSVSELGALAARPPC